MGKRRKHVKVKATFVIEGLEEDVSFSIRQGNALQCQHRQQASSPSTGDDHHHDTVGAVNANPTIIDGSHEVETQTLSNMLVPSSTSSTITPAASESPAATSTTVHSVRPKATLAQVKAWRWDLQRAFLDKDSNSPNGRKLNPDGFGRAHEALLQIGRHGIGLADLMESRLGKVVRHATDIAITYDGDLNFGQRIRPLSDKLTAFVQARAASLAVFEMPDEAEHNTMDTSTERAPEGAERNDVVTANDQQSAIGRSRSDGDGLVAFARADDIPSDPEDGDCLPSESDSDEDHLIDSDGEDGLTDSGDEGITMIGSKDDKSNGRDSIKEIDKPATSDESWVEDNRHDTKYAPAARPGTYLTGPEHNRQRILVPVGVRRAWQSDFPTLDQPLEDGMVESPQACALMAFKRLRTTYGVGYENDAVSERRPGVSKCDYCYLFGVDCPLYSGETERRVRSVVDQHLRVIYASTDASPAILDAARSMALSLDRLYRTPKR
ncbi:hypothetical protein PSEUBRA_002006 [Kalmanozyma brasiliensis GHG001]|uniref:uncharacterized protein n=1 Tax=Kalmanozyma brasiliensis (strain GHG001) TaxID=1365824 RepID=UPI001CEB1AB7|nr:uncharacterized protein PSEUBRA_002006 [Kalmanozyma brasiliensis GHG001]KAF6767027.1 hypothetical protein PSEUBRA_002006 [Kalmanozyma brasiliensis GHG001]